MILIEYKNSNNRWDIDFWVETIAAYAPNDLHDHMLDSRYTNLKIK